MILNNVNAIKFKNSDETVLFFLILVLLQLSMALSVYRLFGNGYLHAKVPTKDALVGLHLPHTGYEAKLSHER